jgi:hypothetical protein
MGIDTNGAGTDVDKSATEPASTMLPEGDGSFQPPKGIAVSPPGSKTDVDMGISTTGDAGAAGEFVDGEAVVYYNGERVGSTSLTGTQYTATGVPVGVPSGESVDDRSGGNRVENVTETGGVDTATFSGSSVRLFSTFQTLTASVTDADGDPVGADRLVVDSTFGFNTDDDGSVDLALAGSVTLALLDEHVEETVDLSNGAASVAAQYAGVKGRVAIEGEPVSGATVRLLDDTGEVYASTETTTDGTYKFDEVPPNLTGWAVETGPAERPAATRGQGEYVAKNFGADDFGPSGVVALTVIDAKTGEPARNVPISTSLASSTTNHRGNGTAVVEAGTDAEVTVGDGQRYAPTAVDVELSDGQRVTRRVEVERAIRSDQT